MVQTLKLYIPSHSGVSEIRRLTINSNALSSHVSLIENIIVAVPKLAGKCFELFWKDKDGEDILITDDNDLAQAIANLENDILKFHVKFVGTDALDTPVKVTTIEEHGCVRCDGCNGKVIGFRYKCLQCHDFDLCSNCNAAGKHSFHDMLKLVSPYTFPRQWLFSGGKQFFKSLFGVVPVTDVIDRSAGVRKNNASYSGNVKVNGTKENASPPPTKSGAGEKPSEESKPSTSKSSQNIQFPPGFPFNPACFPNPSTFMPPGCHKFQDNVRNLIAGNAAPVCDFINNFLKPLGADLRIEVETPEFKPKTKDEKPPQEKAKDINTKCEHVIPVKSEISCPSKECGDAPLKPISPNVENPIPLINHGLFSHGDAGDSGISNAELNDVDKSTANTSGEESAVKNEELADLSVQEMNGNEGWTVINSPFDLKPAQQSIITPGKDNVEVKYPVNEEVPIAHKANNTEVKYPVLEEVVDNTNEISNTEVKCVAQESTSIKPPNHRSVPPCKDDIEDISCLEPEIANSLLKMRSMGFTNEGGWLLRLLQAKKGNIYHALDSLYPNQSQHQ